MSEVWWPDQDTLPPPATTSHHCNYSQIISHSEPSWFLAGASVSNTRDVIPANSILFRSQTWKPGNTNRCLRRSQPKVTRGCSSLTSPAVSWSLTQPSSPTLLSAYSDSQVKQRFLTTQQQNISFSRTGISLLLSDHGEIDVFLSQHSLGKVIK